ncbi:hypothetical protein [Thalassotalea sp. PP2-459]|uniref:hypothetical protein n=1 Tax=Thalassotalea sp. PP2-459 TaxID=1742724 RepID=UPI000943E537|nr:hypothetical protein [Thalassotalea sp. PP2-459]OKY25710.1 hypothetical protein BI291_14970 [Thalassotalea sp. PP2-459]
MIEIRMLYIFENDKRAIAEVASKLVIMKTHILNGDALLQRFPEAIKGEKIIARECLVDGDLFGDTFEQFMLNRATFIASYPQCTEAQYLAEAKPEFEKIRALTHENLVELWFEEDLFCQVNLWYICSLLVDNKVCKVRWVKPNEGNEYSFADMSDAELILAKDNALSLSQHDLAFFAKCWQAFYLNDYAQFTLLLNQLPSHLCMIKNAINAQLSRQPDENGLGYPERKLLAIMKHHALNNNLAFAPVFKEYYAKMAVYSYGDLQVYRMYQQLMQQYFSTYE